MSRLNDAKPADWDSAYRAMYLRNRPNDAVVPELTYEEHKEARALDTQVGGDHYKSMAIQPAEFNHKNGIGYLLGTAISYLAREGHKDVPLSDVKKAVHILKMYVEMEEANA